MAYLVPIHRSSSVRHALKLNFLNGDEECLIVAKANRIEIYALTGEGVALKYSRAIYGKVTMLEKLQPASSSTDHLFIGTDRYTYFTVSWDDEAKQMRTEKSFVDLADKTSRDSQTDDRCLIDPTRRCMALQLYEGIITVVPLLQKGKRKESLDSGTLGEPWASRISNLFVRSSAFLYPRNGEIDQPQLAMLYEDNHQNVCLRVKTLNVPGSASKERLADAEELLEDSKLKCDRDNLELGASHLISVPAPAFGLLVLAETTITYLNLVNNETLTEPLKEATLFVAWEAIDAQRWLLADDYGKLYLLMLMLSEDNEVSGWKLDVIGETSRASVLVYLDSGYVFVGSHQGDSQVIKIEEKSIELMQTISNIAPILDFSIMDMGSRAGEGQINEYSSGQARIVTGSGAFQDGSLRSVRSGVGLEEVGMLGEMDHITEVFALKSSSNTDHVNLLVVSFITETRVFLFNADGEVEEQADYMSLTLSEGTLLAANATNGRLLQVTGSLVHVIDMENGMVVSEWSSSSGQPITAASANEQYLAMSIGGTEAVILDLNEDLRVVARKTFASEGQIACINVPSVSPEICVAGFWQNSAVAILRIDTLESIQTVNINDTDLSVPRSVLLVQLISEQPPTLFVAMADGNVVTFSVSLTDFTLSAKKSIVLGTQQANFKTLPRGDGLSNVFATCEHPSLIYGSEGRIVYSAVTAEKASCVCPFDSEAYPGAIAIATPEDLKIAVVDTERTTHVQTLPVKETVRRVAYSPKLKAFGLGTINRTLRAGAEIIQSRFKLADEIQFKELDTYYLNLEELIESVISAEIHGQELFVVGTAYLDDNRDDSVRGRIIVFEVEEDRMLKVVAEISVKGACRALGIVDGNIVAALIKTIVIYALRPPTLQKLATYRTSTAPISISTSGPTIAVADLMKSVSILHYTPPTPTGLPATLTEIARHFATAWATAVAHITSDSFLEADAEGNLTVLLRNANGVTAEDRRRLEATSEIRLGEMVNRIQSVNVPTSANAVVTPKAFLATVDGSLHLFALISPARIDLLLRLQSALASLIHSPGNMPFNKYRAFKNAVRESEEPYRFVDGELIEGFLDLGSEVQEEVVGELGEVDVEEVRGMVEGLRRLH